MLKKRTIRKKKNLLRKGKEGCPKSKINETDNINVNFNEIKQSSWLEVEYWSKSQTTKFIG